MSAGPDRIVVEHAPGGWRWEYRANGRVLAVSGQSYRDRADCLHALYLVTGVRLDVPKGWRGTVRDCILQPRVRRYLRQLTGRRLGGDLVTATVIDSPYMRHRAGRL